MAHRGIEPEISAFVSREAFPVMEIYEDFMANESTATGTVVMHHGRVKYPGKVVADFKAVDLVSLVDDPVDGLRLIGAQAAFDYSLSRVLIRHRLGRIGRGDDVLLVICSAKTREQAFAGCRAIVDQIKKESLISLREIA